MKAARIILAVLGSALGVLILMALIGWMLPEEHQAHRTVRVSASSATVWQIITDSESFPEWRSEVTGVHALTGRREGWVEEYGREELPLEIVSRDEPRRLVLKIADEDLPFGGTWSYVLKDTDGECELTITEDGEIYNPIFRFVSHFFLDPHKALDQYLEELQARLAG